jgi:hypothetical protein
MSIPIDCCSPCASSVTVNVPGPQGATGPGGPNIVTAATTTNLAGILAGKAGLVEVLPNAPPAAVDYSALTTAGAVVNLAAATGVGISVLAFPHTFIGGTAAVQPVTAYIIGYKFRLVSWCWVNEVLLVGAGGSRVANMVIGAVPVGAPSTITIDVATPTVGAKISGTAFASANTGSASDTFSIQIANGGTAFTAGSGTFLVLIQNMDTADAVASLAKHVNDLITALTP